jgi:hypothetical protein
MKKLSFCIVLMITIFEVQAQTLIATSKYSNATANHSQRKVVRDSLNNVYFVFVDSTAQGKVIKGAWLNKATNHWNEATKIADGNSPSLAINRKGQFNVVFESNDLLKEIKSISSPDFSNWTQPIRLSEIQTDNELPICDTDSTGKLNVFWIQNNNLNQSMIYACVSQGMLTFRKTITTKQEINDIAIANHLQNANDDLIFSAQFSPDSILFLKTTDNMKSIDTLYQTRGTQPCISFNSIGFYHPGFNQYWENPIRLLFVDTNKQLTEVECEFEPYSTGYTQKRVVSTTPTDYICIDDVVPALGYSYLFRQNGILYHGFSYGAFQDWSTILDTITSNPLNPTLAYKNFNSDYVDYVWMQKMDSGFNIYYKRDAKQRHVGVKDIELGKGFTITGYPNPFADQLNLTVDVENRKLKPILEIYNSSAKRVKVLIAKYNSGNQYRYLWDATDDNNNLLPKGIYIISCTVGKTKTAKKVIYTK